MPFREACRLVRLLLLCQSYNPLVSGQVLRLVSKFAPTMLPNVCSSLRIHNRPECLPTFSGVGHSVEGFQVVDRLWPAPLGMKLRFC